ncbi:MAG: DUF814 domain-containing protein [Candidatus Diapherotrites archaeon]|nr:DUF814 domain-containing protein [Candidatus Diapherotrites archaeon]
MELELDLTKSVTENANYFYQLSKKSKKKLEGLKKAIEETKRELARREALEEKPKKLRKKRERDWYEKYHWFFTSDGFLVIAGRDVKTNTEIVRKHMQKGDLYFHADIHGAPSTIIKAEGKEIPERSKREAAAFAGAFSKAFSAGLPVVDVYAVRPEQVKTAAKPGEFLPKGAFVIEGKREWFKKSSTVVAVSFDKEKNRVVAGPPEAIAGKRLLVGPGGVPKGELARKVKHELEQLYKTDIDVNEVLQLLPSGDGQILKLSEREAKGR